MFDLILDSVEDFHTVEERRLHRIFGGLDLADCFTVVSFFNIPVNTPLRIVSLSTQPSPFLSCQLDLEK